MKKYHGEKKLYDGGNLIYPHYLSGPFIIHNNVFGTENFRITPENKMQKSEVKKNNEFISIYF